MLHNLYSNASPQPAERFLYAVPQRTAARAGTKSVCRLQPFPFRAAIPIAAGTKRTGTRDWKKAKRRHPSEPECHIHRTGPGSHCIHPYGARPPQFHRDELHDPRSAFLSRVIRIALPISCPPSAIFPPRRQQVHSSCPGFADFVQYGKGKLSVESEQAMPDAPPLHIPLMRRKYIPWRHKAQAAPPHRATPPTRPESG